MNLGVLASHEGTTLQSILDACADGRIPARVVVVISNNGTAGALLRARQSGVPAIHLSSKAYPEPATLDAAIRDALLAASVDLVFLAGYMKKLGPLTLGAFTGRIVNTHPALLPKFGGQGMYGNRVFEAVLESGDEESGVSVHLVDSDYDAGRVIAQCRVAVLRGDSVETLKGRVQERERVFVVETLAAIARGAIALDELANPYQPSARQVGRSSPSGRRVKEPDARQTDRRMPAFPFRAVFVSRAGSHPDTGAVPTPIEARSSPGRSARVRDPRGLETHSAPSYRPPQESDVTEARPLSAGSGEEQHRPGTRRRGEEESECPIKCTRCQTVAYDRRARGARGRTRPARSRRARSRGSS